MEPVTNSDPNPQGSRKRCAHCGASNKFDAQWCGQCLEKFEDAQPEEDLHSGQAPTSDISTEESSQEDAAALADADAAELLSSLAADTLTSMKTVERPSSPQTPTQNGSHASAVKTATRPQTETTAGAWHVGEEGITWTCLRCESVNAMEARMCSVCGTIFAEAIQPEKKKKARRANPTRRLSHR